MPAPTSNNWYQSGVSLDDAERLLLDAETSPLRNRKQVQQQHQRHDQQRHEKQQQQQQQQRTQQYDYDSNNSSPYSNTRSQKENQLMHALELRARRHLRMQQQQQQQKKQTKHNNNNNSNNNNNKQLAKHSKPSSSSKRMTMCMSAHEHTVMFDEDDNEENEPRVPVAATNHGLVGLPDTSTPGVGQATAHVESTWERGEDLYIFGYGSLMFYTQFNFKSWTPVYIKGYRRALSMGSEHHRGVPGMPGRVFNLELGGPEDTVTGILFRIGVEDAPRTWELLNVRESGYLKLQVPCFLFDRHQPSVPFRYSNQPIYLRTTIFIATPEAGGYLGDAPVEEIAKTVAENEGRAGTNAEYVLRTVDTLRTLRMLDEGMEPELEAIEKEVRRLLEEKQRTQQTQTQQQRPPQLTVAVEEEEETETVVEPRTPTCSPVPPLSPAAGATTVTIVSNQQHTCRRPYPQQHHQHNRRAAEDSNSNDDDDSPTTLRRRDTSSLLPFPATQLCTCMMRRIQG